MVNNQNFKNQLNNYFTTRFLREIAVELSKSSNIPRNNPMIYINIIVNHFDSLSNFYLYLMERELECKKATNPKSFVLLPLTNQE